MPIDYEAEYNNRARVPEHPEIFARWARAAEDYRAEAMKERRAELGLSYGSSLRQFIDLFSPRPGVMAPLALFIHGGYWRSLDPSLFSHMARGLNSHGVAVAVVGYDLCPEVTIAEIIDQIRHACLFLWLRTPGFQGKVHLREMVSVAMVGRRYDRHSGRSGQRLDRARWT